MNYPSMYETIMDLPLFKGTSHVQISDFLEFTHLNFLRYEENELIVKGGTPCHDLVFLLSGSASVEVPVLNGQATVHIILGLGSVIGANHLFGMHTDYPDDVRALETTSVMQIMKHQYLELLKTDNIYLINYLNYLSYRAQSHHEMLSQLPTLTIGNWLTLLAQHYADRISLACYLTVDEAELLSRFNLIPDQLDSTLNHLIDNDIIQDVIANATKLTIIFSDRRKGKY